MKQKEPMIHQLKAFLLLTLPLNDAMPSPLINAVRISLGCLIFALPRQGDVQLDRL